MNVANRHTTDNNFIEHILMVKNKDLRTLIILLTLPFSLAIQAQVTVDEILASVEKNNLRLQAMKHSNEADVLDMKAENALAGPAVEYSPFWMKGYNGLVASELIVSEEIDFPTKYANRRRQANLQAEVLEGNYAVARRDILLEAKLLCIDIIRINQINEMLDKRIAYAETVLNLYEKKIKAGDTDILTYNKAKLERLETLKSKVQTESERQELLQALQVLNGGKSVSLTTTTYPNNDLVVDLPSLIQRSQNSNAEIQAAQSSVKASNHEVAANRQSWLPSLKAGYRRNTAEKDVQNGFMVGATFPLFNTSSSVKAAKKRQLSAQLELDDARQQAEAEIRSKYEEVMRLRKTLDNSDNALLQETLVLLDKALNYGEINAIDYYTEVDNIYSKLESNINIECQYHKLLAQLYKDE